MNASPGFTGSDLTFSVAGDGIAIDPATGALSIATDALREGVTVVVAAASSDGTAPSHFRLTVAAEALAAPVLLAPPALAGSGTIGTEVAVAAGQWSGDPTPEFTFAWCRNGAAITGASSAAYTPGPADDGAELTCRITATNPAGNAVAETAALRVRYPAPVLVDGLPDGVFDEIFDEDSEPQVVPTAFAFSGANLTFSVAGAGATIDPTTGVATIATDTPRSGTIAVTATNSGGSVSRAFQVTVEPSEPVFSITDDQWSARHDLARGVGQRLITVSSAVTVPAGHVLKIYTWHTPGEPKASTATITPGTPYQSVTALPVGSTCYNRLWLYRTSDGAITLASNEITFLVVEAEAPPTPDPVDFPPADVVATSDANAVSILQSWANDWAGTIPAGKSASSERYLDIPSGSYGTLTLTNLTFPQKVHLRSADKATLGARFGYIKMTGCTRLQLEFITQSLDVFHANNATGAVHIENCVDPAFSYSQSRGPAALQAPNIKPYGVCIKGCTRPVIRDTFITDHIVGFVSQNNTDLVMEGCIWDFMKGDDSKSTTSSNSLFKNNWSSLTKRLWEPSDHTDFHQEQTATNQGAGDPGVEVDGYRWVGHMMYQKTENNRSFQGIFNGGVGLRKNFTATDCVLITNNTNFKFKGGYVYPDPSNGASYCTGLFPAPNTKSTEGGVKVFQGAIESGGGTVDNCIIALANGTNLPAGTGSVKIAIGANLDATDYTPQRAYYTGPIQKAPSGKSPMAELMPVAGSQAHWDHASPKGAFNRLREIIEDGIHPGNSPNKVLAAHWQQTWNWDGFVTS